MRHAAAPAGSLTRSSRFNRAGGFEANGVRIEGVDLRCDAVHIELTHDGHLKALAWLEAVVGNNDDVLASAAPDSAGQLPPRSAPRREALVISVPSQLIIASG
jgi:hypothetical protein